MLMILERLPIDIVEIVIVKSNNYYLFQNLKKLILKLSEPKRELRINDKLTEVVVSKCCIYYKLNGLFHREYNKPSVIYYKCSRFDENSYLYFLNGEYERSDGFSRITNNKRDRGYNTYYSEDYQELFVNTNYRWKNDKIEEIIERGFEYF